MTVHENIRRIRLEKHMTQEEVGKACGIAGAAIRAYEAGKYNPKPHTIAKIAKALGCTPAELYSTGNNEPISDKTLAALAQIETDGNINPDTARKARILAAYEKLSQAGKDEAVKRIEELAHIPWFCPRTCTETYPKTTTVKHTKILYARLPVYKEWESLVIAANRENAIIHWHNMLSWCQDKDPKWNAYRICCGHYSASYWCIAAPAHADNKRGFRPVFENASFAEPAHEHVIGTLYMNDQPVRIPEDPTWDGDITDYIPDAKLEFRPALDNPDYQIQAIKIGDILIADRVLLKNISWNDLHKQGFC